MYALTLNDIVETKQTALLPWQATSSHLLITIFIHPLISPIFYNIFCTKYRDNTIYTTVKIICNKEIYLKNYNLLNKNLQSLSLVPDFVLYPSNKNTVEMK